MGEVPCRSHDAIQPAAQCVAVGGLGKGVGEVPCRSHDAIQPAAQCVAVGGLGKGVGEVPCRSHDAIQPAAQCVAVGGLGKGVGEVPCRSHDAIQPAAQCVAVGGLGKGVGEVPCRSHDAIQPAAQCVAVGGLRKGVGGGAVRSQVSAGDNDLGQCVRVLRPACFTVTQRTGQRCVTRTIEGVTGAPYRVQGTQGGSHPDTYCLTRRPLGELRCVCRAVCTGSAYGNILASKGETGELSRF